MNFKKVISAVLSMTMVLSSFVMPASAEADYGTATTASDSSITLNFGNDSITVKGGGAIITDTANGGVLRPDNLKTDDSNLAVLTFASVNLKDSGFDKIDLYAASKKNAAVSVKVGETEIASFANVNNNSWDSYTVNTADLTTTDAEGNLTLNITGEGAKTYCGNYVYVKLYNSSVPVATPAPTAEPTPAPTVEPTPVPEDAPAYLDTTLSFEERAADLVSRMTLEEKVSQIGYKAAAIDRLGVKAYNYWREALHGVARQGKATSFPSPLSMSNTWNRDIVYQVADITSTEARGKNSKTDLSYWSPTINMARDPRWGRNEETYGEDPYLTGQLASEFVKGMQGSDEKYLKTIATLKHFAANNNEKNRRGGSSIMSEYNFRNYYTKVFQNVTEEVMPASVMSSYNATSIYRNGELIYNYKPSAANPYLLTDLLRRNWGFDGYVTSDCGAGEDLIKNAAYKKGMLGSSDVDESAAVADAFLSGLDIECYLGGGCASTTYGVEAVEKGYMSEEELETAIYHLFLQRFRTGEFDNGATYSDITKSVLEKQEHIDVAEKAAEESWVLLKNDGILPLASTAKNIAIVGNYAGEVILGDYSGEPEYLVTPYEGIKAEIASVNPDATLSYLGATPDDAELFNLKSLTLVLSDGKTRSIDLSKAESVTGMTLENGMFTGVTPKASAVIKNVDFTDAISVKAEMSTNSGSLGGSIEFNYGSANGPSVALVTGSSTGSIDTYKEFTADYTGADGGYGGVADLYISASANEKEFTVENYKSQLDSADVIIAYVGTTLADSKESNDRASIAIPSHQAHAKAIVDAYADKTVVAMQAVGQLDTAPVSKAKAIMWTSYNGQTQGTALGKVLTGQVNPSGKLTTTWYTSEDLSNMELSNSTKQTIDGIEGFYTDYDIQPDGDDPGHTYQYYTGTPLYPFGYGLSYTNFEYSNITIDKTDVDANGTVTITADVKNTGTVAGKEAVQLYVSHPENNDPLMPAKQLKGFDKIELGAGETKTVTFTLDVKDMNLFSEVEQKTYVPEGTYTAYVSKNADDEALSATFNVTGTLASTLKTVKAMPDGVTVNGAICEDGTDLESVTKIDSKVSAIMTDEVWVDLENAEKSVEVAAANSDVLSYADGVVSIAYNENASAKLIHASYQNGKLKSVNALDVELKADETVTVNEEAKDGDKFMLWNSLEEMEPLADTLKVVTENEVTVVYTSSDSSIASVDENGIVTSGTVEGIATITVTVTVDGLSKTDSYPVVNKLVIKPSAEDVAATLAELQAAYDKLPREAYSNANLLEIERIYNFAEEDIEEAATKPELEKVLAKAINDMNSVAMDNLEETYTISSVNPKFIEKGTIDYREGGIAMYDGANGTVTNASPYTGIALVATDADGNVVDASKIVWQIKKFDDSVRKVADIDENGNLTVYGNGIVQITAANIKDMTCGKLMVHINMQIEGEYADESNGADLNDAQSGTSGGKDAGSTGNTWIEYKSVKLSNLENIIARVAGKNDGAVYVSLDKSASASKVVASANINATGGWSTWTEAELKLNDEVIYNAQIDGTLDEYGCATVYIQTNGINLDYFRMNYIENNDEIPYIIEKTLNKANGKIKVTLKYRGSTLATDVDLKAEVLNSDGSVKDTVVTTVKGTGEYEIEAGAQNGETVNITVCDADGNALSEAVEKVYLTPVDSEIVVYTLDSTEYDYSVLTGGEDGVAYTDTVNGLSGYGAWATDKGTTYTYLDVNEKEYNYTFTKSWKAGTGNKTKRSLYFTPKAPCKVTAVFQGSEAARSMNIYQSDDNKINQPGTGSVVGFSLEVTDTTTPVYVYGGSSNKQLYAIIVEYYGTPETVETQSADEAIDRPVQFVDWNGTQAVLTKHDETGETKVWTVAPNGSRVQLDTNYFYESDVDYKSDDTYTINSIAVYKDRLYAACDNGLVIVFTECVKCYKLKKVCDFDIKSMNIENGVMYVSDDENEAEINMSDIGGDLIAVDEANLLLSDGAVLVDVRTAEEFEQGSADGSVNIPLDEIASLSDLYDNDKTIIFCCGSGTRAGKAVEEAKTLGFTNTYNGGSYTNY